MTNSLSIDDINKLKLENELISKQYNSLLEQYNKFLKAAKEYVDSNEYCIQELEKKFEKVLELCNAEQEENASYKYNFHVCQFAKSILNILTR